MRARAGEIGVAVVGVAYWGSRHVRVLRSTTEVSAVIGVDQRFADRAILQRHPGQLRLAALASRQDLLIDRPLGAGVLGPADDAVGRSYRRPLREGSTGGRSRRW